LTCKQEFRPSAAATAERDNQAIAPTRNEETMAAVRLIKKYPNRRLYDTQTSTYITLADVKQLVVEQEEFQVVDAKSGEDLTRQILLQIILEEEAGGMPMFRASCRSRARRSTTRTRSGRTCGTSSSTCSRP
jgi:polyhydroxyalkanoate synthesis repressor PhaR